MKNSTPERVAYIEPGQAIRAAWLNQIVDALIYRMEGRGGIRIKRVGSRIIIDRDSDVRNDLLRRCARARVDRVDDNTMLCTIIDPDEDGEIGQVTVAKPFTLQRNPFDGVTWEYADGSSVAYVYTDAREREATITVDATTRTETQTMSPDYATSEHILIIKCPTGLTYNSEPVRWMDVNSAGRQWTSLGNLFDFFRFIDVDGVPTLVMDTTKAKAANADDEYGLIDVRRGVSEKFHSTFDYGDFPEAP